MAVSKPKCKNASCYQNKCGVICELLREQIDTAQCPFFQTDKQISEGRQAAHDRLVQMGRWDLIEKYEYNPGRKGMW